MEETFTTHYERVNYLLEIHATDDVISEADADIMMFIHHEIDPIKNAELLSTKVQRSDLVYDEILLKSNSIEGLHNSIHQRMLTFVGSHKHAGMQNVEQHATSPVRFQSGLHVGKERFIAISGGAEVIVD